MTSVVELIALGKAPAWNELCDVRGRHAAALYRGVVRANRGIKLEHVPYRGAGQAVNDLVAGHVPIGSLGPTPIVPHHKAGTLRILAQSGKKRSPTLPDVPTFQEAGIPGLAPEAWNAVFTPSGTPQTIIARLNSEIDRALSDPAIRAKMLAVAQEPVGGSTEQLALLVQRDSEKYAQLAKLLSIKAE